MLCRAIRPWGLVLAFLGTTRPPHRYNTELDVAIQSNAKNFRYQTKLAWNQYWQKYYCPPRPPSSFLFLFFLKIERESSGVQTIGINSILLGLRGKIYTYSYKHYGFLISIVRSRGKTYIYSYKHYGLLISIVRSRRKITFTVTNSEDSLHRSCRFLLFSVFFLDKFCLSSFFALSALFFIRVRAVLKNGIMITEPKHERRHEMEQTKREPAQTLGSMRKNKSGRLLWY